MSISTSFSRFFTGAVATLVLSLPMGAMADEPDLQVYGDAEVPVKKPSLTFDMPPYNLNSQVFVFPTGLKIMMQSDKSHPIVSYMTVVDHGASEDFEGKEGLAHFVEHTWFRSRHTFVEPVTGKETEMPPIMDLIQDMGSLFNATTHADITDYRTVASKEWTDLLMQFESWRLKEPYKGVTADEISVETNVITNEWRRRNEQSTSLIWDYSLAAVFPEGHQYGRRSTKETLDRIELEDLQKYFDMHYRPSETTIVVVGDFEPSEMSSIIFANFDWELLDPNLDKEKDIAYIPKPGRNPVVDEDNPPKRDDWLVVALDPASRGKDQADRPAYPFPEYDMAKIKPRVPQEPDTSPLPPVRTRELITREAPIEKDLAAAVWSLPGGFRSDNDALQMVGGIANVLVANFMEPPFKGAPDPFPGLEFGGCGINPQEHNTMMFCAVEFDPKKTSPENAIDKVVNQLNQIWNPDLLPLLENQLMARARNEGLRDIMFNIDNVATPFGGRAEDLANYLHYSGNPQVHSTMMNNIVQVQAKNVAARAEKYLKRDRYASVHFKPLPKDERDTRAEGSAYAGASDGDTLIEAVVDIASIDDQKIIDSFIPPQIDGLDEVKLANGMRVVVVEHGEVPFVSANLILRGGEDMQPENLYDFQDRFTNWEFQDVLGIAGSQQFYDYDTASRYEIRGSSGNLDGALWYMRKYVDTVKADTRGLGEWIKEGKTNTRKAWYKRDYHLAQATSEHIFPGHQLSEPMLYADWDQFGEWGGKKVNELIDRRFQPENATLVIVGKVDPETAKEAAHAMFSSWKGAKVDIGEFGKMPKIPDPVSGNPIILANEKGNTQSQIRGRCRLNYAGPEDDAAVDVLSSLIGNATFKSLRVKEGLAYSPGAFAFSDSEAGYGILGFSALATNAGVGRVVEFMNEQIAKGEAGEFDDKEVTLHKLREARGGGVAAQSVPQLTGRITGAIKDGKSWEEMKNEGAVIAKVTKADLTRLMQGCGDHFITTIEGPEDIVKEKLDEKGFKYETLDWKASRDEILQREDPKKFKKFKKAEAKKEKKKAKKEAKEGTSESTDESGEE